MAHVLVFDWINDEDCEISLDGARVITMGHGPHGWDGMEGIRDAMLAVGRILGATVAVIGDPAI